MTSYIRNGNVLVLYNEEMGERSRRFESITLSILDMYSNLKRFGIIEDKNADRLEICLLLIGTIIDNGDLKIFNEVLYNRGFQFKIAKDVLTLREIKNGEYIYSMFLRDIDYIPPRSVDWAWVTKICVEALGPEEFV